jgi:acyl-CoA thioester hydrolase
MAREHVHNVRIYYEDTDFSGYVYHANYLKYMERAREHLLGPESLRDMFAETGVGFVVYKVELAFQGPARFADVLEVRTVVTRSSDWRSMFQQNVHRQSDGALLVKGAVELVCVDEAGKLVKLPTQIAEGIDSWQDD